jgi:hypothetical protein
MSEETKTETGNVYDKFLERIQSDNEYYEKMIPFLKTKLEYETLVANIEEQELKSMTVMARKAQIMAPPPSEEGDEEPADNKRKLKKD